MKILIILGMFISSLVFPNVALAQASCLNLDTSGSWAAMENSCDTGIDFEINDEDSCSGWSCSGYVGPNGRFMVGSLKGHVRYYDYYSPGGNGDVVAMCDASGDCYCWD